MWDALITIGNLVIIPALIPTVLNKHTYIPRVTSGISLIGVSVVVVGLIGEGLVASPIVLALIGLMWVAIFILRSTQVVEPVRLIAADDPPLIDAA